jgi:hypothetical protein
LSAGRGQFCSECGNSLPAAAGFCRSCGARADAEAAAVTPEPAAPVAPPAPEPASEGRPRRRLLALACLGVALVGAGLVTAFLLGGGDGHSSSSSTTVASHAATVPAAPDAAATTTGTSAAPPSTAPSSPASGSIGAGVYVQAGSFRTTAGAEAERLRLEAAGIRVSVVDSDQAEELYPGFQVLLGGPFVGTSERRSMVKRLHRNGVPSAFARPLSPAVAIAGPEDAAGIWIGTLELSGFARPNQDGELQVTLSVDQDGRQASLEIPDRKCSVGLSLLAASELSLSFSQDRNCLGAGNVVMRPEGETISLTLLPPGADAIVVGRLVEG